MAQISIDTEEYKELLTMKIGKEFEEQIKDLTREKDEANENQNYWWNEYYKSRRESKELKERIESLEQYVRDLGGKLEGDEQEGADENAS